MRTFSEEKPFQPWLHSSSFCRALLLWLSIYASASVSIRFHFRRLARTLSVTLGRRRRGGGEPAAAVSRETELPERKAQ